MEKEENVYEETNRTEHSVDAEEYAQPKAVDGVKEGSAVLGKFKDVDALVKAYGSLQAEFTRRSQKLKELEKTLENFGQKDAGSGAEKLRKNAAVRRDRAKEFDAFVAEMRKGEEEIAQTETSANDVGDIEFNADIPYSFDLKPDALDAPKETFEAKPAERSAGTVEVNPTETGTGDKRDFSRAPTNEFVGREGVPTVAGNAEESSEALYTRASRDEQVRLRIIGEYLSSLGRTAAPVMAGGVGALATPPRKAKSIGEAGDMALRYFKKPSV